jgi:dUTP pyrophosphatase
MKFKKLNKMAVPPSYAKKGDAGLDLTAISHYVDDLGNFCYGTGLAIEIPDGYVGLIFPRSSISKTNMNLSNAVGVIDSGYRGEISFKFRPSLGSWVEKSQSLNDFKGAYNVGEKVGQLVIVPYLSVHLEEVDELSTTERGDGGFGHTGK